MLLGVPEIMIFLMASQLSGERSVSGVGWSDLLGGCLPGYFSNHLPPRLDRVR